MGGLQGCSPHPPPDFLASEIIFEHSAKAHKLPMCPNILGNEASETPPPFNSKYLSMPMKIGVILLFRIFQSASSLRGVGIRYPGGLEKENCEIDNFLLYNCEKDITYILIINTYFITEHMKKKSEKIKCLPPHV